MKLLLTNDWHFASKNPVSRTDDYNGELFELLDKIALLVKRLEIEAILHAGDVFHDKGRIPWPVFVRLAERLATEWPMLSVAGNHDLVHDRFESVPNTPYGALVATELIQDISRRVYTVAEFIETGVTHQVPVYGVPWPDGGLPGAFDQIPPEVEVVVAHAFATPEGGERWGCFCHKYEDLARAAPQVRLWHFGHDHTDHGVFTLSNGAAVVNIGALSRGALDTDNLARRVKVAIVDVPMGKGPVGVLQVDLQAMDVDKIFDLPLRAQKVQERQQVEAFIARLQQAGAAPLFAVDYRAALAARPMDAAVRDKVQAYIDRAEAQGV